jgi:hypothetical protein
MRVTRPGSEQAAPPRLGKLAVGHSFSGVMRIELSDGEMLDFSKREAQELYEALLGRVRQRGATSAAGKLRSALTWSSGAGTRVALDHFETEAGLHAVRENERSG